MAELAAKHVSIVGQCKPHPIKCIERYRDGRVLKLKVDFNGCTYLQQYTNNIKKVFIANIQRMRMHLYIISFWSEAAQRCTLF